MKNLNKLIVAGLLVSSAITSANAAATKSSDIVLKARVGTFNVKDKAKQSERLMSGTTNGYGLEVAADYFFTPNIAVEGAIGYDKFEVKQTGIKKNVSFIPLTLTGLYYFTPEADFSPYAGLGYTHQMSFSKVDSIKIKNGGGFVAQLGSDFKMNDSMSINVDLKYTHKASHKTNTAYKSKLSTVSAMVGVAFPM